MFIPIKDRNRGPIKGLLCLINKHTISSGQKEYVSFNTTPGKEWAQHELLLSLLDHFIDYYRKCDNMMKE